MATQRAFILLAFAVVICSPAVLSVLCRRFEACSLVEHGAETAQTASGEEEEETEGSGEGGDEQPKRRLIELCTCEGEQRCTLNETNTEEEDDWRMIRLDERLELHFCNDVRLQLRACQGNRALARVIGRLDGGELSFDVMTDYVGTRVFCYCTSRRFHKDEFIEPWKRGLLHAFRYKCATD